MNWNDSQKQAITVKGSNILVSAAAGSGKTAVLVERIIRRILDPGDPLDLESILVVTFTEAAAGEMRQRIGNALQKELDKDPDNEFLRQQLALLNRAAISTIHSFCLGLIRKYFFELDLEPGFRVGDNNEIILLRWEVMDGLFEDKYAAGEERFLQLADAYGGKNGEELKKLILSLYDYARSQPYPERWLQGLAKSFPADCDSVENLPWVKELKRDVVLTLEEAAWLLEQARAVCHVSGGPYHYTDTIDAELAAVKALTGQVTNASWTQVRSLFQTNLFRSLPRKRAEDVDEDLKEKAKKLRKKARDKVKGLAEKYFFRKLEEHAEDIRVLSPVVEALVSLVNEFATRFWQAKRDRGLLDFADLEQLSLRLLVDEKGKPTEIARGIQARYEEVLVDEYQDVNAVQNAILEAVARQDQGGYMFMVGDVKQSIYRFRLAEPGLFMQKEEDFSGESGRGQLIALNTNYRSRRNIIDAVNLIFQQLFDRQVGELDYSDAFLHYGRLYPEDTGSTEHDAQTFSRMPVELHLIERTGDEAELSPQEADDWESIEELEKEAMVMARRIKQLVAGDEEHDPVKVWDKDLEAYRPISYRDIVVLLRSTRYRVNKIVEIFRQWEIPVYADVESGYFNAPEIEAMLSLLQVIDNPQQDIPLAAVLRSPIVGLSGADLARIRLVNRQGDFYSAVCEAAEKLEPGELKNKLNRFLEQLDRWRTMARREPLSTLIWAIYQETTFLEFNAALPGGKQRQANLRALYDRACQFDRFVFQGLFRFLRFIEKLQESEGDLGTARALGENEDVVRVMSIHKSKGLEFPVVFVADMGKKFNDQDTKGDLLFHQQAGLGLKLVDRQRRLRYPTLSHLAVRQRIRMENLAEEMRVLYVALTRAREQLILVGSKRELDQWCRQLQPLGGYPDTLLPGFFRAGAECYLDWVCGALVRHAHGEPLLGEQQVSCRVSDLFRHPSRWQVKLWSPGDLLDLEKLAASGNSGMRQIKWEKLLEDCSDAGDAGTDAVKQILSWQYPLQDLVNKAAKLSVSDLKRGQMVNDEEDPAANYYPGYFGKQPRFVQETGVTAAERGSAVHAVMQHLDLYRPVTEETVAEQIDAMVDKELLTPELAAAVPVAKIVRFFRTAVGRKMLVHPEKVHRELPFSLGIPAGEIYPELAGCPEVTDKVLVQGIVDCCIQTEGSLILVDYKTDELSPDALEQVKEKYRLQLELYARALSGIFQQPVREKYLYFFAVDKLISLD